MSFCQDKGNILLLWIIICYCIFTVLAVPNVNVQPSPVATVTEGSVLWLTCTYDLDGGTLGQLLWQDGGTAAVTVIPSSTDLCSTSSITKYTPKCNLTSNEVQLGILTPVHGHTCSCTIYLSNATMIGTKSTQVSVLVPVPSVTFTPPVSDTVTVTPGGSQTYTCVTGSCRPQAQIEWYKDGLNVTTQTGSVDDDGDKFVTTSSFTLTGVKGDSPTTVQCRARNEDGMTPVKSDNKLFVVQWPPDGPPVISGYTNSSILYVNDTLSLSCRQTGGNPLSTLTWTGLCGGIPDTDGSTGTESVSTIIITVTKGYNQGTCGCVSIHPQPQGQDRSEVIFTVHYPPSTPIVSETPTHPWLEGESGTLSCSYTEGFPALTRVEWFRNGRLQTGESALSITLASLTKDDNGAGYTCCVKNEFTNVKLTNLTSSVVYLNVEYYPLLTLTPTTLTVVEGQTTQVTCDTEGNPTPRVEWLRGGSSVQTGQGTSLTLTLGDINRSETDNYTCRAEGMSSVQGRQLITQKKTSIIVQYPPDVTVVVPSGVEEGDTNVQLMCQTLGDPNTLTSQSWTQTIGQAFITDQFTYNTSSHDTIVLAKVSIDDVGMYMCSVSNGIPDRNGQTLQSNSAVLDVKVAPKFCVSTQKKNFYGRLHEPVTIRILFYSHPDVTSIDDLVWTKLTSDAQTAPPLNMTYNLTQQETVNLTIKGKIVTFTGQGAIMTLASLDQDSVGNYTLTVYNDERHRHSNVSFAITPSGPPDMPTNFQEIATSATSITVKWTKGFNGGHTQTFVILYGPEGGAKTETLSVKEQRQETYTKEITGLQPNTRYQINIYAYNYAGNSSFSSVVDIISETQEKTGTRTTAIAGGVGGAIVFLLVIIAIAVVLYRRRNPTDGCYTKGSHQKSGDALFNASGQNEDEDGIKPNILYESAGPYRSENQQDDSALTKPEYAVVEKKNQFVGAAYAEVIPKKDRKGYTEKADGTNGDLYAEVQKNGKKKKMGKETTKVGKGKMKETKKTFEEQGQAGTVYENVGTDGGKSRSEEMYANSMDERKSGVSTAEQQKQGRKKNQDGLVYLDVEFQRSQNGTRQAVIHGIENRNEYALVDFTKHASPLPEEVMNNDESAKN